MADLLWSSRKPRRGVRRPHLPYHSHILPAQPLTCPHLCPHNRQATAPIPECFAASTTISRHPRPYSWHSKAALHPHPLLPGTAVQAGHCTECCFHMQTPQPSTSGFKQATGRYTCFLLIIDILVPSGPAGLCCLLCLEYSFPALHASRSRLGLHHSSLVSWKISIATPFLPQASG